MLPKLRKTRDNHLMELTDFIDFLKKNATPDSRGHSSDLFELVVKFLHTSGEVGKLNFDIANN
jgi:hypothetical protein